MINYFKVFDDFLSELKETYPDKEIEPEKIGKALSVFLSKRPEVIHHIKLYYIQEQKYNWSYSNRVTKFPLLVTQFVNYADKTIMASATENMDHHYRAHVIQVLPQPGYMIEPKYASKIKTVAWDYSGWNSVIKYTRTYEEAINQLRMILNQIGYIETKDESK